MEEIEQKKKTIQNNKRSRLISRDIYIYGVLGCDDVYCSVLVYVLYGKWYVVRLLLR
jgi:hypothetical protein